MGSDVKVTDNIAAIKD